MKLRNTAKRAYMHGSTIFKAGEEREFAKEMAEAFLKCEGVEEAIDIAKMKEELAALKAKEVTPSKKSTKKTK
jgi:lipopolysaccharide biosynthesis regulator YciM